ncbi:hypothetical protein DFH06DRAFT_1344739 [Mycena polygramma]|nr:hypothetical protein DFH06DRAFT_1344739 [Mycena polygramma]
MSHRCLWLPLRSPARAQWAFIPALLLPAPATHPSRDTQLLESSELSLAHSQGHSRLYDPVNSSHLPGTRTAVFPVVIDLHAPPAIRLGQMLHFVYYHHARCYSVSTFQRARIGASIGGSIALINGAYVADVSATASAGALNPYTSPGSILPCQDDLARIAHRTYAPENDTTRDCFNVNTLRRHSGTSLPSVSANAHNLLVCAHLELLFDS